MYYKMLTLFKKILFFTQLPLAYACHSEYMGAEISISIERRMQMNSEEDEFPYVLLAGFIMIILMEVTSKHIHFRGLS